MKTLSKEAETAILDCVGPVSQLVDNGSDPTDAVVKVAQDRQLPTPHAALLATAYNVAATTHHRKSAASVFDKAADFPVASPERVAAMLEPQLKSASAIRNETVVDPTYAYPPGWHGIDGEIEKVASASNRNARGVIHAQIRTPAPLQVTPESPFKAARARAVKIDELRRTANGSMHDLARGLDKLAQWFNDQQIPLPVKMAEQRMGPTAKILLDRIAAMNPHLTKKAEAAWSTFNPKGEQFVRLQELCEVADRAAEDAAAYKQAEAEEHQKLGDELIPAAGPVSALHGVVPHDELYKYSDWRTALGVTVARDAVGSVAKAFQSPDRNSLVARQMAAIASPEHEQQLRDIGTQSMLHDLLTDDPVVSGFDPFAVTNAYNDLSGMAPRVSQNPMAVAAILRKRLATDGSVDPYDIDQILRSEKQLRDTQSPYEGDLRDAGPRIFS